LVAACALLMVLGGCGPKRSTENVAVSPLESHEVSLFDVADAQAKARDKLLAAQAVAETADEKAKVAQAQAAKQRGDDFLDQKAFQEANEAFQQTITLCDQVITPHAGT